MYSVDLHRDLKLKAIAQFRETHLQAVPVAVPLSSLIEAIFFSIGKDRYLDHWWLNGQ